MAAKRKEWAEKKRQAMMVGIQPVYETPAAVKKEVAPPIVEQAQVKVEAVAEVQVVKSEPMEDATMSGGESKAERKQRKLLAKAQAQAPPVVVKVETVEIQGETKEERKARKKAAKVAASTA